MEWDTGRIIAVLVILLLVAAIFWLMTRAGRKRAAARYAEAQGRPPAHDAPPVETYGSGAAGGTLGTSALAATGVGAAALGAAVSSARDDGGSETRAALERAAGVPEDAGTGDRARGTERPRFDAAADADRDGHAGSPGDGRGNRTDDDDAGSGVLTDAYRDGITRNDSKPRPTDRPRFDPSIDGHPTPERGATSTAPAGARTSSEVDAVDGKPPAAFSAPNVELKETDGNLRSQGSGRAVADVAPGSPGAPGRGPAPSGASVSDSTAATGNDALTGARASRLGVTAAPGAPEIGDESSDRPSPTAAASTHGADAERLYGTEPTGTRDPDGPAAFSAPNVPRSSVDDSVASEGSGRAVSDVAPGRPSDATPDAPMPAGSGLEGTDARTGSKGSSGTRTVAGTVAKVAAGAAVVAAAGAAGAAVGAAVRSRSGDGARGASADADDWSSRASTNVDADARGAPAADHGPGVPAVGTREGAATGRGAGGGVTSEGSWASDDGRGSGGAEVSGVSAARIHPAGNDAQQGMGETVPLVDKAPSTDPAAPVPAADVAARGSDGAPPTVNTRGGADVADAGPRDDRPDGERMNLPDPATAGGLDALRPAPSTGASTGRGLDGLPDAGPALQGDFAVRSGDGAHDVREMLKVLNLRESDATRLGVSVDEYRALREGGADALPHDRLDALRDRLAGMMV